MHRLAYNALDKDKAYANTSSLKKQIWVVLAEAWIDLPCGVKH